jgi:glycosyltransferase involved in cell wall biosynthesis
MIVRDEEQYLAGCLESAADLVDEIIIVDTGSTDSTREIARRFGARVFDFQWADHFGAARNESLRHATGDWIFWLDADERIDRPNRTRLQQLFVSLGRKNQAFGMKLIHLPAPGKVLSRTIRNVRLFRNHPKIRWQNRIHEDITPALRVRRARVVWTDIAIYHAGYQDPIARARKNERDLRLLLMDYEEDPDKPSTIINLCGIYLTMGRAADALPLLQRGLLIPKSGDRLRRGFYRLIVRCHRLLCQSKEALAICGAARVRYPRDVALRVLEGELRAETGDISGAETCYMQLLQESEPDDLNRVSAPLLGFMVRQRLAELDANREERPSQNGRRSPLERNEGRG